MGCGGPILARVLMGKKKGDEKPILKLKEEKKNVSIF
jgi:hypothetical protein